MSDLTTQDCAYCLDGFRPAGIDTILGPVYRECVACGVCETCYGQARFPVDTDYFERLVDALDCLDIEVDLCRDCLGVTTIRRTTTERTQQP